jgi:dipeptidyl aminopeptidase/acylaminoacyl peptidase
MTQPRTAPYGSWKSPITANDVYAKFTGVGDIQLDLADVYWAEDRPEGRTVIVCRRQDGQIADLTPLAFNVRTRVHEYGGGEYMVAEGRVYFSNFSDQRIYQQTFGSEPTLLTPIEGMRYADAVMDRSRGRLIAVREDHTTGASQAINTLVSIRLDGADPGQVLVFGNDFYSNPRLNPDGKRLAWLTWNHPNMPWDGTELWVSELAADGSIGQSSLVAGGRSESIFQPEWSPDGTLYFISDRSGWWNLYRWRDGSVETLVPMEAEFGEPQWVFGLSTYSFCSAGQLVCSYLQNGLSHLATLDTRSLKFTRLELPYTSISDVHACEGQVYFVGGSATEPVALIRLGLATGQTQVLRSTRPADLDPACISSAEHLEYPTGGGLTAHGFFYPPRNPDFMAPAGELPPLLVMSHGGPTGSTSAVLRYSIQYWTTRGIAVLDVDYGGSTGYGRAYRERLKGQWGIVDVTDCINGARYLALQGLVDERRLAITGGSAGGFTTLCALTFHDTFKAGSSYYGVSDLEALARDTHKFESRYLDGLVGEYPEQRSLYLERSPIYHTDRLACPMILLQGLDDPVVPPSQAQLMYEAVKARKLPVAYIGFPGEKHGFVKAENSVRALEATLYFFSKVFKFDLADPIEPVKIENLRI